jgi:hypothetical protein
MHKTRERNLRTVLASSSLCTSDIPLIPPRLIAFTADDKHKQELHQIVLFNSARIYAIRNITWVESVIRLTVRKG